MAIKCPKCQHKNPDDTLFCGKCGTQFPDKEKIEVTETLETPKEELTTGSTFAGRYQIIEELGKGGMGRVYKVHDTKIKEKIALKLIKPEIAKDKKTIERFSNELKFARKIRHKNICQMFDLGEEQGTHFITMEFVDGQDLKKLIRQSGQLAIGTAMSIAKQVCDGLVEAHTSGVVHRDLKPSNIMIDSDGNARIMDFGIARAIEGKGITGAGVMIGTPEYMSPEQVEGKEVDQRSDIYSLGVILYEMVTGKVPFEGDTPFTVGVKHKSEFPQNPKEINSQIPDDMNNVILKCLEKQKDSRFQDASEVWSKLEKIEQGLPATERDVPKKKTLTSKEITVTFGFKKLVIPTLVILIIAVIGLIIWSPWTQKEVIPKAKDKPSIAVLPFRDLSLQEDQEILCDGMTTEIITKLSGIQEWKVMNTASVMRFKNTEKDIKDIGQELGVTTVLLGSVRREANDLRVDVQLVNTEDRFQIWGDIYEQKITRIFEIQSIIAERVVRALEATLSPEEEERLQKRPTDNLEAYNLYLSGRWFWEKRTEEGLKKAIEFFDQAIEKDPNYALAYVGKADSYNMLGEYNYLREKEAYPKARAAAEKALEIDNTLAEAHTSLAWIKCAYDWDWESADREFKRAIELNPNYANAHHWYAIYLMWMTRYDEAIAEIKLALELDPLSIIINRSVGAVFLNSHHYDQAIEALERTSKMDPNFVGTSYRLGIAYREKSMYKEALAEFQKENNEYDIAIIYIKMGNNQKAIELRDRMIAESKTNNSLSVWIAQLCFSLGENEKGFGWLHKALEERRGELLEIKYESAFDSVRSDPRFKEILKKMNLE